MMLSECSFRFGQASFCDVNATPCLVIGLFIEGTFTLPRVANSSIISHEHHGFFKRCLLRPVEVAAGTTTMQCNVLSEQVVFLSYGTSMNMSA